MCRGAMVVIVTYRFLDLDFISIEILWFGTPIFFKNCQNFDFFSFSALGPSHFRNTLIFIDI